MRAHSLFTAGPAVSPAPAAPPLSVSRLRSLVRARVGAFGDVAVAMAIRLSSVAAPILLLVDALLRPRRTLTVWKALRRGGLQPLRHLRRIWFARAARESFRVLAANGLADAVLRRVVVVGDASALDAPAVLAVYHTPWARLLARWMCADGRVMLFAGGLWAERAPSAHLNSDTRGMRELLGALRRGRSAAVTVDHFGERGRIICNAEVFGHRVIACAGAARLAARAGVPLIPVALRWHDGRLEIRLGHRFSVTRQSIGAGMGAVLSEFNAAVRSDISSWGNAHRFLSLGHDRAVRHRPLGVKEHDVARSGNPSENQDL